MRLEGQTTHKEALARMMKRPGFKEAYDALEPEFAIYDAILEARIKKNLTQKQLAQKVGIAQSALARIESGKISSTIATIQKILANVGLKLTVVKS
jgi:ribosome-binding protein aMBF1 (putative translation factor)